MPAGKYLHELTCAARYREVASADPRALGLEAGGGGMAGPAPGSDGAHGQEAGASDRGTAPPRGLPSTSGAGAAPMRIFFEESCTGQRNVSRRRFSSCRIPTSESIAKGSLSVSLSSRLNAQQQRPRARWSGCSLRMPSCKTGASNSKVRSSEPRRR